MDGKGDRTSLSEVLALAAQQHGVVTRRQLLELGLGPKGIEHRIRRGRLHRVGWGVYAVGRPELGDLGRQMAAVLACGPEAVLSHGSAAVLWRIAEREQERVEVSVPPHVTRRQAGVRAHRTVLGAADVTRQHGIPVTTPVRTLVDLALRLGRPEIERAIGEADRRGLTNPPALRAALQGPMAGRPGAGILREVLDRRTFRLTDSELERRFLSLVRGAGLPLPETGRLLNGFRVDFCWPDLGLVVETDGLTYHRTPAQQAVDRRRDQAHAASGMTALRFTHEQVAFEPAHVRRTLRSVATRLNRSA